MRPYDLEQEILQNYLDLKWGIEDLIKEFNTRIKRLTHNIQQESEYYRLLRMQANIDAYKELVTYLEELLQYLCARSTYVGREHWQRGARVGIPRASVIANNAAACV